MAVRDDKRLVRPRVIQEFAADRKAAGETLILASDIGVDAADGPRAGKTVA